MCVTKLDFPEDSSLYKNSKEASYSDTYMMYTQKQELSIYEIYEAFAKATPGWVNRLMVLRNGIVSFFKLKSVDALGESIKGGNCKKPPKIGEKLDAFTLFYLSENEIVVGEDDKHLNFRLSIQKRMTNNGTSVVVSTVVFVNNTLGKGYLFCILPFHKIIMRKSLINARKFGYL